MFDVEDVGEIHSFISRLEQAGYMQYVIIWL